MQGALSRLTGIGEGAGAADKLDAADEKPFTLALVFDRHDPEALRMAETLTPRLIERLGRPCYLDRKLLTGWTKVKSTSARLAIVSALSERLENGVGCARGVLLLQTPEVCQRASCLLELYWASSRRIPIIPLPLGEPGAIDYAALRLGLRNLTDGLADRPTELHDIHAILAEYTIRLYAHRPGRGFWPDPVRYPV